MVLKCCNRWCGIFAACLQWLVPVSCDWCYWGGWCWLCGAWGMRWWFWQNNNNMYTSWSLLGSGSVHYCMDPGYLSYSTFWFDLFFLISKLCHLLQPWVPLVTEVMIFADYWLEPIMIIRARGHGNEVTARSQSQISPHQLVPTTATTATTTPKTDRLVSSISFPVLLMLIMTIHPSRWLSGTGESLSWLSAFFVQNHLSTLLSPLSNFQWR